MVDGRDPVPGQLRSEVPLRRRDDGIEVFRWSELSATHCHLGSRFSVKAFGPSMLSTWFL